MPYSKDKLISDISEDIDLHFVYHKLYTPKIDEPVVIVLYHGERLTIPITGIKSYAAFKKKVNEQFEDLKAALIAKLQRLEAEAKIIRQRIKELNDK